MKRSVKLLIVICTLCIFLSPVVFYLDFRWGLVSLVTGVVLFLVLTRMGY